MFLFSGAIYFLTPSEEVLASESILAGSGKDCGAAGVDVARKCRNEAHDESFVVGLYFTDSVIQSPPFKHTYPVVSCKLNDAHLLGSTNFL